MMGLSCARLYWLVRQSAYLKLFGKRQLVIPFYPDFF